MEKRTVLSVGSVQVDVNCKRKKAISLGGGGVLAGRERSFLL